MKFKEFPLEEYLMFKEEKEKALFNLMQGKTRKPLILNQPDSWHWTSVCKDKCTSLEAQLEYLANSLKAKTDVAYTYIEPWYGVGVYAAAFGCKYSFSKNESPQTLPIYNSIEDLRGLKYPSYRNCEVMQTVLEYIRYFKDQVGDSIDISYTDTQSPNDTASLILDPCEFFIAAIEQPENLHDFLSMITDLIIDFSDAQREAIGSCFCAPGHIMMSNKSIPGLSISDDNMAVISPKAYENTALEYNKRLAKYYDGIAIHTCGNAKANLPYIKRIHNVYMVDLALGTVVDPTPNLQDDVLAAFEGSNTIVKIKVGDNELNKIEKLIKSDLKLIIELRMSGSIDERNRRYEIAKEKVHDLCSL